MNKIDIAKKAARFVVAAGVYSIVHSVIKNNIEPEGRIAAVKVAAGALVLADLVSEAAKGHTDKLIDRAVKDFQEIRSAVNNATAEETK